MFQGNPGLNFRIIKAELRSEKGSVVVRLFQAQRLFFSGSVRMVSVSVIAGLFKILPDDGIFDHFPDDKIAGYGVDLFP